MSDKIGKDMQWAKNVVDHILLDYGDAVSSFTDDDYSRKLSNYQLYNNILNQEDFEKECNPFGLEIGQFKDNILPYNKTPNKIQVLLGEEFKRPLDYRTVKVSTDGIRSKLEIKKEMLKEFLLTSIEEVINQFTGIEDPQAIKEYQDSLISPEDLEEYMAMNYVDGAERLAYQMLEYLKYKQDVKNKMSDGFKHGLISGDENVWLGIRNGEAVVDVLNSLGVIKHKSSDERYIQNGLYAGYRSFMSPGDILDEFAYFLSPKDQDRLEGSMAGPHNAFEPSKQMKYYYDTVYDRYLQSNTNASYQEGSYGRPSNVDWLVQHVEWKSQKKVGFLKYVNDYGEDQLDILPEEFKVPSFAEKVNTNPTFGPSKTQYLFDNYTLEWDWIPEVWQGYKIGQDMYCDIRPKKLQFRDIDNPKSVKLGYHGLTYNNMNASSVSLMDRMKPFQYMYFIIVHKLKKLIANDRGKVFHFDTTMVDEKIGLEKTIYYLNELDIDFFNPLHNADQPGSAQRGKISSATDRSNMQHIMAYINLMAAIDQEIGDVAGVTKQREGSIGAAEAVTNSQQAILQSSTITEAVYFQPHLDLWGKILNSLVEAQQVALLEGGSAYKQYVLDDMSVQTLELTADEFSLENFAVFISNVAKDTELFDTLKGLSQALIQNDKASLTDIVEMLKTNSIAELERKLKKAQTKIQKIQQQQMESQQEMQQQAIQAQQQEEQAKRDHEVNLQKMKDEAALEREKLKLSSQNVAIKPGN